MRTIIVLLLALSVVGPARAEPVNLRAVAVQRLASGKLAAWERQWYQQIAAGKPCASTTVWSTQYGKWEGYNGTPYHLAANPSHLPRGTVVYLEATGRLMVVTNRGASSNDRIARRKGAAYWVDVHTRYCGEYGWTTRNTRLWVVGFDRGWAR